MDCRVAARTLQLGRLRQVLPELPRRALGQSAAKSFGSSLQLLEVSCLSALREQQIVSLTYSVFLPSRSGEKYITPIVAARCGLATFPPRLLRNQQTLREWPLLIRPLRLATESSPLSHFHNFLAPVFV